MFFRSTIFGIFSLTHKEEEVWLDGPTPHYVKSQVVSACQVLGL